MQYCMKATLLEHSTPTQRGSTEYCTPPPRPQCQRSQDRVKLCGVLSFIPAPASLTPCLPKLCHSHPSTTKSDSRTRVYCTDSHIHICRWRSKANVENQSAVQHESWHYILILINSRLTITTTTLSLITAASSSSSM